jgi:hypothetical protein
MVTLVALINWQKMAGDLFLLSTARMLPADRKGVTKAQDKLVAGEALVYFALVYLKVEVSCVINFVGEFKKYMPGEKHFHTGFKAGIPTAQLKVRII